MTDRELMQQALEALSPWAGEDANHTEQYAAYHVLRKRLAQHYPDNFIDALMYDVAKRDSEAQPEQEPVAVARVDDLERGGRVRALAMGLGLDQPLYTTPPQRKPLTEKRIEELYSFWVVDCQDIVGFARAVERTVKGEV